MDGAAEIRVLSPTAILGYGFPEASLAAGLARDPHVIAVDAGSSDPGPYYLGAGVSFTDREAVKRDLRLMLRAGRERRVPVVVGSAGGAGAEVVLTGRAYDPAVFAAVPILAGFDPGVALHMGK